MVSQGKVSKLLEHFKDGMSSLENGPSVTESCPSQKEIALGRKWQERRRKTERREALERLRTCTDLVNVAFDLTFEESMRPGEIRSLVSQVTTCYYTTVRPGNKISMYGFIVMRKYL
jgi:hypothetical protein